MHHLPPAPPAPADPAAALLDPLQRRGVAVERWRDWGYFPGEPIEE